MSRTYFPSDGQASGDQYQQFTESTPQPQSSTHDSTTNAEGYILYPCNSFPETDIPPQYHPPSKDGSSFEDRLRPLMRRQGDELRTFAEREARNINEIRSQAATMANASPHEFLYSVSMQLLTPQDTIARMDHRTRTPASSPRVGQIPCSRHPRRCRRQWRITAGTKLGLEFWKGLRGGGLAGLKSLKLRCKASREGLGPIPASTSVPSTTASRKSLDIK